MKKLTLPVAAAFLLTACGNTQIEHCSNVYDPVEKGNVDAMNADKGEVISEIPTEGAAEEILKEGADPAAANDSISEGISPSDVDENGEVIAPEEGGKASLSEQAELEQIDENTNRRTSDEARRKQEEAQRRALEEMNK
jgi:glucose dehydrogenase